MNANLELLVDKFNEKSKEYLSSLNQSNQKEFIEFFHGGAKSIAKIFSKEVEEVFKSKKIDEKLEIMSRRVESVLNKAESYAIKEDQQKVVVKYQDKEDSFDLTDMSSFVQSELKVVPQDKYFLFILAYMSLPRHFDLVQLYSFYK